MDGGGGRSIYERGGGLVWGGEGGGAHYSVILLKMPLKDSPREAREKGRRMECDNRKMPLMAVSPERRDAERRLC